MICNPDNLYDNLYEGILKGLGGAMLYEVKDYTCDGLCLCANVGMEPCSR